MEQIVGLTEKWRSITKSQGWKEHPAYNKQKEANWIDYILQRNCLLKYVFDGTIEVTWTWGSRHTQLLDSLKEMRWYWKLTVEARNWSLWRACFERSVIRQTTWWHWLGIMLYNILLHLHFSFFPHPSIFSPLYFHNFLLLLLFFLLILFLLCFFFFFFSSRSYLPQTCFTHSLARFKSAALATPQTFVWTVLCWFCKWSSHPFLYV